MEKIKNYINLQTYTFKDFPCKYAFEEHSKNKIQAWDLINEGFFSYNGKKIKVEYSHFFIIEGTQFLVYETGNAFFVYGSLYNIFWGIFYKDGSFEQSYNEDNILGYKIDNIKLWQKLKKLKKAKLYNFSFKKRKNILLFGCIPNIGHHIWNEQTGIEYLLEMDLLEQFDEIWIGCYDYFNFLKYFKEKGLKIIKLHRQDSVKISTKNILYLATELVVFSKTIKRLNNWITRNTALEKNNPSSPIICIQLRQNTRKWIGEIVGIANIINEFKKRYPSSYFIIDGFSKSFSSLKEEKINIKRDISAFNQILNLLNDCGNIECTIGKNINDKMNIIKQADLVLSPIGSGGILTNWVLDKTIIVYGPTEYYDWTKQHSETHLECYNNQIYYIPKEHIIMQENNSDYDFDWNILFNICLEKIDTEGLKQCIQ